VVPYLEFRPADFTMRSFFKNPVNHVSDASLLDMIRPNLRFPNFSKDLKMKKLIAALIAGLFAVSAFAADAPASASASAAPAASTDASAPAPKAKKAKKAKKSKAAASSSASADAAPAASAPAASK